MTSDTQACGQNDVGCAKQMVVKMISDTRKGVRNDIGYMKGHQNYGWAGLGWSGLDTLQIWHTGDES